MTMPRRIADAKEDPLEPPTRTARQADAGGAPRGLMLLDRGIFEPHCALGKVLGAANANALGGKFDAMLRNGVQRIPELIATFTDFAAVCAAWGLGSITTFLSETATSL